MMKKLRLFLHRVYIHLLERTKISPKIIVFKSSPDFSDNARALSDYLVAAGYQKNKYRIYWIVNNAKRYRMQYQQLGIKFVDCNGFFSFLRLFFCYKASFVFSTHELPYKPKCPRAGQLQIRLWHGCSYKDKDATNKGKISTPSFDYALVSGPMFVKTKAYFWNCPESRILSLGYPRYDWLINSSSSALALRNELLAGASKLIMWMPTFRQDKNGVLTDTQSIRTFPILKVQDDWENLDKECTKYGIRLVIKLHPLQIEYGINWDSFNNILCVDNSLFETSCVPMYSFLSVTDGLISDYSSVAVDYLLVNKPIAYTLDDFQAYSEGRGFIVPDPLNYMPGYHIYEYGHLVSFLKDISMGIDVFKGSRESIKGKLVTISNHYCKDIVDAIGLNI